jgi:hypothetical protein
LKSILSLFFVIFIFGCFKSDVASQNAHAAVVQELLLHQANVDVMFEGLRPIDAAR